MKKGFGCAVSAAMNFFLCISLLGCLASCASIKASEFAVCSSAIISTALFSSLSYTIKRSSVFAVSIITCISAFGLAMLFSLNEIARELNYVVNRFLSVYSPYLPVSSSIRFADSVAENADVLFSFLAIFLCAVFTTVHIRAKCIFPQVGFSVLLLIPCFLIVNTLPSLFPLFTVLSVIFGMFISRHMFKSTPFQGGISMLSATAAVLVISLIICAIFPVENYKRFQWQKHMQARAEQMLGMTKGPIYTKDISAIGNSFNEKKDLNNTGKLVQTETPVMKVYSPDGGNVYLRATAYTEFENNVWSISDSKTIEQNPLSSNPFTLTKQFDAEEIQMSIITEKSEPLIYVPYLSTSLPNRTTALGDVLVSNDLGVQSYEFSYTPSDFSVSENIYLDCPQNESLSYSKYAYNNCTQISEKLKAELQLYAVTLNSFYENGIVDDSSLTQKTNEEKAKLVKQIVSSSAKYSLSPSEMPEGADLPVWFLNQAGKGYCVHFATTAAMMLRALDVPSRYVTGYYFSLEGDKWTTVTSDNAHAWVEYLSDSGCWIPLEATPPSFSPAEYSVSSLQQQETKKAAPASSATQPSVTEPETVQTNPERTTETHPVFKTEQDNKHNGSAIPSELLYVISAILFVCLALLLVWLRRSLILKRRKKRLSIGTSNKKTAEIFRYIKRIERYTHQTVPLEIERIALKAKFSNHRISSEELEIMEKCMDNMLDEIKTTSSKIKKIYRKYLIVLF